jgi:hypothetical protein
MVTINRQKRDLVFRAIADPTRREILGQLTGGQYTCGTPQRSNPTTRRHTKSELKTDIPIHLNLKAAQQVVYCEGTLLVAYSW